MINTQCMMEIWLFRSCTNQYQYTDSHKTHSNTLPVHTYLPIIYYACPPVEPFVYQQTKF